MELNDKYRLLIFKYLYDLLGLKKYEIYLQSNNIDCINDRGLMCHEEIICSSFSKYFYLLNAVDLTGLSEQEINYLQSVNYDAMDDTLKRFLEQTYQRVLLTSDGDIYYGPMMDEEFLAQTTNVVLGIKYDEFGFAKGELKDIETVDENLLKVAGIISEIETQFKKYGIKIIKYNELFEYLNHNDITIDNR